MRNINDKNLKQFKLSINMKPWNFQFEEHLTVWARTKSLFSSNLIWNVNLYTFRISDAPKTVTYSTRSSLLFFFFYTWFAWKLVTQDHNTYILMVLLKFYFSSTIIPNSLDSLYDNVIIIRCKSLLTICGIEKKFMTCSC